MIDPQDDIHSQTVGDWEKKAFKSLTPDQQVEILQKAIRIVVGRACVTLSIVSVVAILERVLHQSKKKFPVLSDAKIEAYSINFKEMHNKNHKADDISEALRFLLIELLRVLGRITANVLTTPVHNELLKVTWTEPEKK